MISAEEFLRRHPTVMAEEPHGDGCHMPDGAEDATQGSHDRDRDGGKTAVMVTGSPSRCSGAFGAVPDEDGSSGRIRGGRGRGGRRRAARVPRRGGFAVSGRGIHAVEGPDNPEGYEACREAALTLLDAAPRSSGALDERLRAKGYAPSVAAKVVRRLVDVGLVDDEAYACSMVRYCLSRQLGRMGAVRELMRKGLGRPLSEQVVERFAETGAFVDSAYELGRRVARRTEGMDRDGRRRRLWSAGGRKGHDPDLIRRVADDLFRDDADGIA